MIYRVIKKFDARGGSGTEVGSFNTMELAKAAIITFLQEDQRLHIKAVYSIFEGYDILDTYDQSLLESISTTASSESTSQQSQGQNQRFSPSPLSVRPRAPGTMPSSFKNDDEN